jgi:hypothetical protein
MATPVGSIGNGWWALVFAYSLSGLSLSTLNSDWLARAMRDLRTGILETATAAPPTERMPEQTRRQLTHQTQRMALAVGQLRHENLSSENITARRKAVVALVLLAGGECCK